MYINNIDHVGPLKSDCHLYRFTFKFPERTTLVLELCNKLLPKSFSKTYNPTGIYYLEFLFQIHISYSRFTNLQLMQIQVSKIIKPNYNSSLESGI